MTKLGKGLFAYPWTIAEQGVERTVAFVKEQLGVDELYVCASYHSGRLFQPSSRQRVKTRHVSGLSFIPDRSLYPAGLQPKVDADMPDGDVHRSIRQACREQGVAYHAWVVGLHNSSLGREHPECCVQNAFGDVYDYALCPSHPAVQAYLAGLAEDVCIQLDPEAVMMETPGFLGFVHGHHHELVLSNLGPAGEYLLSLCFCPDCKRAAAEQGIDTERLQQTVRRRIDYLTEHERGAIDGDFAQAELASLLLEDSDVYLYTRVRLQTVTRMVASLRDVTRRHGKKLYVVPSVFTRPGSKAWMEGVSLSQLAPLVDAFVLLSYFAEPDRVRADAEWLRMFIGDTPFVAGFNAGAPTTIDEAGLHACVQAALPSNPQGVAYYNLSLLTQARLEWIGSINRTLHRPSSNDRPTGSE